MDSLRSRNNELFVKVDWHSKKAVNNEDYNG